MYFIAGAEITARIEKRGRLLRREPAQCVIQVGDRVALAVCLSGQVVVGVVLGVLAERGWEIRQNPNLSLSVTDRPPSKSFLPQSLAHPAKAPPLSAWADKNGGTPNPLC